MEKGNVLQQLTFIVVHDKSTGGRYVITRDAPTMFYSAGKQRNHCKKKKKD